MLIKGWFSVVFMVGGLKFREEYRLPYRTEEEDHGNTTLRKAAEAAIAKDLDVTRGRVHIVDIMEVHNDLIVEE